MAKFLIEVDTDSQTLNVTVNGKKIENVDYASAYCCESMDSDEEMHVGCSVSTSTKDDSGLVTYTSMCASQSKEGIAAEKIGKIKSKDFPELVIVSNQNKIQSDIKKLFEQFKVAK